MIEGLVTGTLIGHAEERQGKHDSAFVLVKVKTQSGEGESLIVNVIAFAAEARAALLALDEGDTVAVSGALTPNLDRQAGQHAAGAGPGGKPSTFGLPRGPQARGYGRQHPAVGNIRGGDTT